MITLKEVCEILGVDRQTVKSWEKKGFLISIKHPFSNRLAYKEEEVRALLEKIAPFKKRPMERVKND